MPAFQQLYIKHQPAVQILQRQSAGTKSIDPLSRAAGRVSALAAVAAQQFSAEDATRDDPARFGLLAINFKRAITESRRNTTGATEHLLPQLSVKWAGPDNIEIREIEGLRRCSTPLTKTAYPYCSLGILTAQRLMQCTGGASSFQFWAAAAGGRYGHAELQHVGGRHGKRLFSRTADTLPQHCMVMHCLGLSPAPARFRPTSRVQLGDAYPAICWNQLNAYVELEVRKPDWR